MSNLNATIADFYRCRLRPKSPATWRSASRWPHSPRWQSTCLVSSRASTTSTRWCVSSSGCSRNFASFSFVFAPTSFAFSPMPRGLRLSTCVGCPLMSARVASSRRCSRTLDRCEKRIRCPTHFWLRKTTNQLVVGFKRGEASVTRDFQSICVCSLPNPQ